MDSFSKLFKNPLTRRTFLQFASLATLTLFSQPLSANNQMQTASHLKRPDLDKMLQKFLDLGAPGVLAQLKVNNKIWSGKIGVADRALNTPILGHEIWRIASVTKLFTAALTLRLVDKGFFKLDQNVRSLVPVLKDKIDPRIQLQHLLKQTSGLLDYVTLPSIPWQQSQKELLSKLFDNKTTLEYLQTVIDKPLGFKPGQKHKYSNTDYLLLELIIEQATQKSYLEALKQEILDPLGLTKTGLPDTKGRLPDPHLHGYAPGDGPDGALTDYKNLADVTEHTLFGLADGALYSDVNDLSRFMDALLSEKLLSQKSTKAMFRNMLSDRTGEYIYGLGIMSYTGSPHKAIFGHEGRELGTSTQVFSTRDRSKQLILVVNTDIEGSDDLRNHLYAFQEKAFR